MQISIQTSSLSAWLALLRLAFAGAVHHVTSRGNRREDVHHDDIDGGLWLATLALCCERFIWAIHAWCQMSNHDHLAMQQRLDQDGKHGSREIPRLQRRALAKLLNYYRDSFDHEKQGTAAAYATGDYTLQQVADEFVVHSATEIRTVTTKRDARLFARTDHAAARRPARG